MRARWDGDARGQGIGDGSWIARSVSQLRESLDVPMWVAEAPEDHLLQHVQRACAQPGTPWQLIGAATREGIFDVDLRWTREAASLRQLRADAFALIGEFAEVTTFIRQVVAEGSIEFHVTTGFVAGDTNFTHHGHLIRLYVTAPEMSQMLAGMNPQ